MTALINISEIKVLRGLRRELTPDSILRRVCSAEINGLFEDAVEKALVTYDFPVDYATLGAWIAKQNFRDALHLYIEPLTKQTLIADYVVACLLASIFDFPDFVIAPGVFSSLTAGELDGDKLLQVNSGVEFKERGAFVGKYFVPYDRWFTRGKPVGPFVNDLIFARLALPDDIKYLALRVDTTILLHRQYYADYEQRARFYGPLEITPQNLVDPFFPETATGTLTHHVRTCTDPKWLLNSYDLEKLDVFWTRRDNQKILQIEELIPLESKEFKSEDYVANRYLHSIWDCALQAIIHLDGAVKIYSKTSYLERLHAPMHKCKVKPVDYLKLFRIDGNVDVCTWSETIQGFFYGNELVQEYFSEFSQSEVRDPDNQLNNVLLKSEINKLKRRKAAFQFGPMPAHISAPAVDKINHEIAALLKLK